MAEHTVDATLLFAHLASVMRPLNSVARGSSELRITDTQLADRCGTTRRAIMRARRDRQIPLEVADRWAIRAGVHPADIWPDFYDGIVDGLDLDDFTDLVRA